MGNGTRREKEREREREREGEGEEEGEREKKRRWGNEKREVQRLQVKVTGGREKMAENRAHQPAERLARLLSCSFRCAPVLAACCAVHPGQRGK